MIELNAARLEAERRRQGVIAQTRRAMLDLQHEAASAPPLLEQELTKAEQRDRLMRLTAPAWRAPCSNWRSTPWVAWSPRPSH